MPWKDVITFEEVQDLMLQFLQELEAIEAELRILKELRVKFMEFVNAEKS